MSTSMILTNESIKLKLQYGAEAPEALTSLCAARRDSASFQMIVNSDSFYALSTGLHDWYSSRNKQNMIGTPVRLRVAVEAPFPVTLNIEEFVTDDDDIKKADILLMQDTRESAAHTPTAVWCDVNVPEDAKPGDYTVTARLFSAGYNDDETLVASKSVKLTVYPYALPDPKDWKFYLDLWQHNSNIARKHDVPLWSDEHFAVIKNYAESLAALGQKSIMVCASDIPWHGQRCFERMVYGGNLFEYNIIEIFRETNGSFTYDYSKLQKYIDICTEAGISGDIEVIGLVNVWGGKEASPLGTAATCPERVESPRLRYLDKADGCMKYMREPEQINDYVRALEAYFIKTGQIDRARVGADEPADIERYRESVDLIRTLAPSFKFKTAINHVEFIAEFGDVINDFSPYLRCATREYDALMKYKKQYPEKKFLWYVCCGGTRPNTYIRTDLIESRMVGILTSIMRFDGFLRWNYTVWPEDPRNEIRFDHFEAGDTNFVYPAHNGGVLLSLRYKNLQRGIADYELLEKLREIKGDDFVDALLDRIIVTRNMNEINLLIKGSENHLFTTNWETFNSLKADVLEMLSE